MYFFGHRDYPHTVQPKLREILIDLITNHDVDTLYVGNHGQFDALVRRSLRELNFYIFPRFRRII